MRPQQRTPNRRFLRPTTPEIIPDLTWTVAAPNPADLVFTFTPDYPGTTLNGKPAFLVDGVPADYTVVDFQPGQLTVSSVDTSFGTEPIVITWPARDPAIRTPKGGFVAPGSTTITVPIPRQDWVISRIDDNNFLIGFPGAPTCEVADSVTRPFINLTSGVQFTMVLTGGNEVTITNVSVVPDGDLIHWPDGSADVWCSPGKLLAVKSEPAPPL